MSSGKQKNIESNVGSPAIWQDILTVLMLQFYILLFRIPWTLEKGCDGGNAATRARHGVPPI